MVWYRNAYRGNFNYYYYYYYYYLSHYDDSPPMHLTLDTITLTSSFTKLRLAMDKASGRSRGFAFLDFDTKETAESAVAALSGLEVDDRQLKIDLSEPKERSYKAGDSPSGDRAPRAPRPPSENSVFLGNLDFSTTEDAIKDMFESALGAGAVQKVRIATDRDTGRAKGFAHVDFGSADVAARAVAELNGVDLMGRPVRVDHAQRKEEGGAVRPPRERSPMAGREHSIFLGNLAWDITPELVEDMINDVLGPGLYTQVRLAIDRETGRQRGFGHIDFKDADSAERAVKELDGLEVMGRQLRADHAQRNAAPGGFSGGGGRGRGGGGGDRYGGGGGQDSGSFGSW